MSLNKHQSASKSSINVRIQFDNYAYHWQATYEQLNYNSIINHIYNECKAALNGKIDGFEYADEEGDRITVTSNDDMKSLLKFYFKYLKNSLLCNRIPEPMVIFPKIDVAKKPFLKLQDQGEVHNPAIIRTQPEIKHEDLNTIVSSHVIDKDQIFNLGVVSEGNSGVVYKCFYNTTKQLMALKMRSIDTSSNESKKQMISELEILYQCRSPYVIAYYGAFFDDSRIAICTEFMDCGSLSSYKQIPEDILARISFSIIKGLNYLNNLKILHRDLKPSNVLLNSNGEVKLCDFGDGIQMLISLTSSCVGTNAYMSPERIKGGKYSIEADVWSLGITILETALGYYPYVNKQDPLQSFKKPFDLLECIMNDEPCRIPQDKYSIKFSNFIEMCLEKNPNHRPKPFDLLANELFQNYSSDESNEIIAKYLKTFT